MHAALAATAGAPTFAFVLHGNPRYTIHGTSGAGAGMRLLWQQGYTVTTPQQGFFTRQRLQRNCSMQPVCNAATRSPPRSAGTLKEPAQPAHDSSGSQRSLLSCPAVPGSASTRRRRAPVPLRTAAALRRRRRRRRRAATAAAMCIKRSGRLTGRQAAPRASRGRGCGRSGSASGGGVGWQR